MDYIETGKIVNTHGVRGDMRVQVWSDDISAFSSFDRLFLLSDGKYVGRRVTKCAKYKDSALIHLDGIEDCESAAALKESVIYVSRDMISLPEGRVLCADIKGLKVIDAQSGRIYGTLDDISDGVASQYYEIKTADGRVVLMPAVKEFIYRAVPGEAVYIIPPEGLFDEI